VDLMAKAGVKFVVNTEIGKDIPSEKLLKDFDAVVLAGGATKPRDLPIEGRQLNGVHFAMDFLHGNTKTLLDVDGKVKGAKEKAFITAKDKHVMVIGGGDTGTDCVGTSMRHGCKGIVQLEIMPKPPEARAANNPWPEWPKVYKMDYGQEEAAAVYGSDPRQYLVTAKKFVDDGQGNVSGVEIVQVEWAKNDKGQFIPKDVPGTNKIIPAQLVLLAMGFLGPEDTILGQLNVERDERSNAKAAFDKFSTSIKGVFAAGDMRRGQSLVVWAIAEGRGCAREVDRFLMGHTDLP
jgi:glutamate synthase (NADPH) small chain